MGGRDLLSCPKYTIIDSKDTICANIMQPLFGKLIQNYSSRRSLIKA